MGALVVLLLDYVDEDSGGGECLDVLLLYMRE